MHLQVWTSILGRVLSRSLPSCPHISKQIRWLHLTSPLSEAPIKHSRKIRERLVSKAYNLIMAEGDAHAGVLAPLQAAVKEQVCLN